MADKVKHTPGPWRVYMSRGFHVIGIGRASDAQGITDGGFGVWGGGDAESLANAHLIAAAPDLLSALRECIAILPDYHLMGKTPSHDEALDQVLERAREAVAKAEVTP